MQRSVNPLDVEIAANQSQKEKKYWLNKLSGNWAKSYFPPDYEKNREHNIKFASYEFKIDSELFSRIIKLSKGSNPSIYIIAVAGFFILTNKYMQHENNDPVIGTPITRQVGDGEFINTVLPLRNQMRDNITFKDFLIQTRETIIEAAEHQNYPVNTIIYDLDLPLSHDSSPLFDVAVLMTNLHERKYLSDIPVNIIVSFNSSEGKLDGKVEYNSFLYHPDSIKKIINHFIRLLKTALSDVNMQVGQIDILSKAEKEQLLFHFNNTNAEYFKEKTIQELFEMQVEKVPGKVAAVGPGIDRENSKNTEITQLTYKELDKIANRLAAVLGTLGVKTESICGLMIAHSIEMAVGILGILKAGGAYLPINMDCPLNRVYSMVKDSGAKVLLCQQPLADKVNSQIEILHLDNPGLHSGDASNPGRRSFSSNLAYVIYTSGSTGHPKGVLIEHRNILNYISWRINKYEHSQKDASLQLVTLSFDGFASNFYPTLLSGGKVIFLNENKWGDIYYLRKSIKQEKITNFSVVPSMYRIVLNNANPEDFETVRFVVLAGEKADRNLIKKSRQLFPELELINEYGPTENSVTTSANFGMTADNIDVIGSPISNNFIYILDETRNLKPVGVPGELWISGDGLMRGYLNRPELTSEKMKLNPYQPKRKMYRTGDIAKWLPDGKLVILGRIDNQVQIRGFRIELEEIERELLKLPPVKEVVVLTLKDSNSGSDDMGDYSSLYAFFIANEVIGISEIREHLLKSVPDYMVPTHFVKLEKMPLKQNGKIDHSKLEKLKGDIAIEAEYVAPRNEIEETLTAIWTAELGLRKIGIRDNYFNIGGDSIKSINLLNVINEQLGLNLKIVDLYNNSSIEKLADKISRERHVEETDEYDEVLTEIDAMKKRIFAKS